jgi:hypothetical protein
MPLACRCKFQKGRREGMNLPNSYITIISFNQLLVFRNVVLTFSYNLIQKSLNSKGTSKSSNILQRLFLGTLSKNLLESKKQKILFFFFPFFQHSFATILRVIKCSIFEQVPLQWRCPCPSKKFLVHRFEFMHKFELQHCMLVS